jgi:hypothetical protein
MRRNGWADTWLTLHELRAWLGSLLYREVSPVATIRQLRHKSIAQTEQNYLRYQIDPAAVDVI